MPTNKERAAVFRDTIAYIEENKTLKEKTEKSIEETRFFSENEEVILPENPHKDCKITVMMAGSFEAAAKLSNEFPGKRIAVLNFAAPTRPGGGAEDGKGGQEESLCRASTLFPTLKTEKMWEAFYGPHMEQKNNLGNDDCIYSPGVVICKTDTDLPKRIPEEDFVTVDVITCAAPNLWLWSVKRFCDDAEEAVNIPKDQLYDIHLKRAKRILKVCAYHGADIVVLGAFGCGIFKNDPQTVARAMMDACKEFDGYFDQISFAIKTGSDKTNYNAFSSALR